MNGSNLQALAKIENYCNDIENSIIRFGNSKEIFLTDRDYQNTVAMSLLQIGELTTHLSDDFKELFSNEVDFVGCKRFRNIVAHNYGVIDFTMVWDSIQNEVPQIKAFCQKKRVENEVLNKEVIKDVNDLFDDIIISSEQTTGRK